MSLMRRRGMLQEASGGTHIETWADTTKTSESVNLYTATMGTAWLNRWNNEPRPIRIVMRFYMAENEAGDTTQTIRLTSHESGAGQRVNFVSSGTNVGVACDVSDGVTPTMEIVMEYVSGSNYKVTWSTNKGTSGVRSNSLNIFNWNVTKNVCFAARCSDSKNIGVGSRLLVLAEYE